MLSAKKIFIFGIILALFFFPLEVTAATKLPKLLPNCDETIYVMPDGSKIPASEYNEEKYNGVVPVGTEISDEPCGFDDFVELLMNGFRYALVILGALVLFFYMWGGFSLITSAGNQNRIEDGKNKIKGATIGMLIVLCAWVLVASVVYLMTGNKEGKLFSKESFARYWWGSQSCHEKYNKVCTRDNLHEGCGGPPGTATCLLYTSDAADE